MQFFTGNGSSDAVSDEYARGITGYLFQSFRLPRVPVLIEKHLSPEVKEVLLELGEELGTTDLEGQLSALSQAHIQLQRFQDTYRVTYQKKGKLYRSLGLLAGLLLAVLFC